MSLETVSLIIIALSILVTAVNVTIAVRVSRRRKRMRLLMDTVEALDRVIRENRPVGVCESCRVYHAADHAQLSTLKAIHEP